MNAGAIRRLLSELRYMVDPRPIDDPVFPLCELEAARRYYDEHGWAVIRDVFSRKEIDRFREGVVTSRAQNVAGDLLSNPLLSHVVTDDRTVRIAKALLPGQPVYYGDSGWNTGSTHQIRLGFHKDNADKEREDAPDWRTPYTGLNIAVYLQDSRHHSGGLAVRDRSQNTLDAWFGRPIAVPATVGDVIVWSFRTSHSGYSSRLRLFPNAFVPIQIQGRLSVRNPKAPIPVFAPPPVFRPPANPDRIVLLLGWGIDDHHMRRNIRYNISRRWFVERLHRSTYSDAVRARLREQGIRMIDVAEQVRHVDLASVAEEHRELPDDEPGRAELNGEGTSERAAEASAGHSP